jgi:hypothetical protein
MDNVISEYQKWKQQGESLRVKAKQAMEGRFRDLLLEAAQIAQEYHRDFGANLKPPPTVTAFRFKAAAGAAKTKPKPATAAPKPDPKVTGLLKQREQVQKKLEVAKAAGKPTRNLDDRLYEIEDELRLAGGNA